jgi:hypothetical protein
MSGMAAHGKGPRILAALREGQALAALPRGCAARDRAKGGHAPPLHPRRPVRPQRRGGGRLAPPRGALRWRIRRAGRAWDRPRGAAPDPGVFRQGRSCNARFISSQISRGERRSRGGQSPPCDLTAGTDAAAVSRGSRGGRAPHTRVGSSPAHPRTAGHPCAGRSSSMAPRREVCGAVMRSVAIAALILNIVIAKTVLLRHALRQDRSRAPTVGLRLHRGWPRRPRAGPLAAACPHSGAGDRPPDRRTDGGRHRPVLCHRSDAAHHAAGRCALCRLGRHHLGTGRALVPRPTRRSAPGLT